MLDLTLLNGLIQKDPGVIVGPIATFMGWIIDFIFNLVYPFTEKNSLGISIIVLTLIMRFVMLPLAFKSQKSVMAMQKLAPEIEKIKNKYGSAKDPESMQKMNAETQALYAKHKVNPLSGCLPLFIQMPVFFALNYLMNQSFLFIGKLSRLYDELANAIYKVPYWTGMIMNRAPTHVPKNMQPFDIAPMTDPSTGSLNFHNLKKILNRFSETDWNILLDGDPANPKWSSVIAQAPKELYDQILNLYAQKQNIEIFCGLNLLDPSGWLFPGVLIPILTAVTTFLTSWLSMKVTAQANKDPNAMMQQRIMLLVMPVMMGALTINYPSGVGIYWITSSVFQVIQQALLNQKYGIHFSVQKKEEKKQNVG
ncbi:MAG: YidC/Oxa1 family membrane protein insertase [Clostridiales bacterium]|nr:YidC/Oxa1 family membrane protein insertase [Clostridiales bacterium]